MQAALPMGGNKITGGADPTVSTDFATKNYVDTSVASFFSTGDVKLTYKQSADTGWLLFDDGNFGSASSDSSNSNNVANLALFTLLFNSPFTDANVPLLTSGGGATTRAAQSSASAAWAANCRMSLPKTLGRALGIAGAGAFLTARVLGQFLGEETHLLATSEIPAGITSSGSNTIQVSPQTGGVNIPVNNSTIGQAFVQTIGSGFIAPTSGGSWGSVTNLSQSNSISVSSTGGGGAHNNMQPTTFLNAMIKV